MKTQNRTRILFLGTSISGGGAERVFINIINSLDLSLFEVKVLLTCPAEDSDLRTDVETSFLGHQHMKSGVFQIIKYLRNYVPHYIFTSHGTIAWAIPLITSISGINAKIIARVAVTPCEKYHTSWKSNVQEWFGAKMYRKMHLVIAQTEYMRQDIVKSYKVHPNKVRVIRNYIDFERVIRLCEIESYPSEIKNESYNIVAIGALYSVKGFDLLIEAVSQIKYEIHNINLLILGDERYEEGYKNRLLELAKDLNVSNIVHLLGHKDNPYPYLKNADLFVLSSRKEGFPNVVLEALSVGTPVVATDCVNFKDIITSENGIVVKKAETDALAKGIVQAYESLHKPVTFIYQNFDYNKLFSQ